MRMALAPIILNWDHAISKMHRELIVPIDQRQLQLLNLQIIKLRTMMALHIVTRPYSRVTLAYLEATPFLSKLYNEVGRELTAGGEPSKQADLFQAATDAPKSPAKG